jgi:cobalt-zinc-cadmium efflux system membrane fusion protein
LGEKFNGFVEVKSGLKVGQKYAAGNSYLIKAELGKSGASHDH